VDVLLAGSVDVPHQAETDVAAQLANKPSDGRACARPLAMDRLIDGRDVPAERPCLVRSYAADADPEPDRDPVVTVPGSTIGGRGGLLRRSGTA
jgi:hypothetical protein